MRERSPAATTNRATVTLKTVAKAAGVHTSTVSRALRRVAHDGDAASPSDIELAELAQAMGYVPNPNAASLTTRRSMAFGVLVPRLTDNVLATVYDALEETANRAGYATFVSNTHDDPEEQRRLVALLRGRAVDGLIIGDARLDNDNIARIHEKGANVILVSRRSPGALSVTIDDTAGGRIAGEHLVALGHKRIGVIAGPLYASTAADRLEGFRSALAAGGVVLRHDRICAIGFDVAAGRQGAQRLLDSPEPPTAIFAMNDDSALGVLGVLRERGLTPGRDISVLGYNDIPISRELTIPLSTVGCPVREMGARAAETMLALVHRLPVSSVALQPTLVPRATTAPPPA
ncbi:substrate-binding domain-containing protein [Nocardia sp. SYP-A9097]|uniref:LacI family DNA-binding transcriptional regulator n=1 Tax=Nocardia sp. SYP-A9097 TaxID=2663237 RepID=UPI00129B3FC2|nr:LacI family DNA-binding transcriptional regulator [Nocardia sp. SYP-A9097]MRH87921.1 substrate-binding domain-containing protein [Nocardia sp. SYP-A9097]